MVNVQTKLKENECTGCGLCTNICPVSAVEVRNNALLVPVRHVDCDRCISCGKCLKFCPQLNEASLSIPQKCYAAYPKEEYQKTIYSSGGAATLMATAFMKKYKGVVCGCTWDQKAKQAKHIIVSLIDDLEQLSGSKYVQSDIKEIYSQLKQFLKQKRYVLFIGTPCQVDAILRYCNSEYLFTADLICHGTPSALYLESYLHTLPNHREIRDIRFRGKYDFWFSATDAEQNKIYREYQDCDPYFYAFLRGTIYRDNCYQCPYAQLGRVSDITLGDFWGLERRVLDYSGNISLVLCNSAKGESIIASASEYLIFQARTIKEAVDGNLQLSAPMPKSNEQREFSRIMHETNNFMKAFKQTTVYKEAIHNKKRRAFSVKKRKIKEIIYRIIKIKGK